MLDMVVAGAPPALLLFTHEDRPIDRAHLSVEGLDSGVIVLRARPGAAGRSRRRRSTIRGRASATFINLGERAAPVIELGGAASADASTVAVVGAGTDNLLDRARAAIWRRRRPSRWARILRRSRRCRAGAS